LPIVKALQVAVAPLGGPWLAKFNLVLGAALALMFASYQLLVRHSFIGAVLTGRRASNGSGLVADQIAHGHAVRGPGGGAAMNPTSQSADDDLTFLRSMLNAGDDINGPFGEGYLAAGICYGV
jgi:hypothetical protein